jgi:RNA polymerase sigma-70 factor, ECF subfamily
VPISSSSSECPRGNRADVLNVLVLEGTMDAEFFEAAALPLFDQLYNLAHWLTGDRADAEDLVQETYAKALKGIKSFQEGTNFRAWMYTILRNAFLTSRSWLKVQNEISLEDDQGHGPIPAHSATPESIVLQLESSAAVIDAIAALPVIYREVVLLSDIEELSYKETARALGVPIGTVMSRLSRGRNLLKQTLAVDPAGRSSHAV